MEDTLRHAMVNDGFILYSVDLLLGQQNSTPRLSLDYGRLNVSVPNQFTVIAKSAYLLCSGHQNNYLFLLTL
jgi:hypothetical protein